VNNIKVTARECTRALAEDRLRHVRGPVDRLCAALSVRWELARVELQLLGLQLAVWVAGLRRWMGMAPAPPPAPAIMAA
jgi:hypothetical protein